MDSVWIVTLWRMIDSYWPCREILGIFSSRDKANKWIEEHREEILSEYTVWDEAELSVDEWEVE